MKLKDYAMEFVKHNRKIYYAYEKIGTLVMNLLKVFTVTDEKLILFNSFGGKKFDDSPYAIYQEMVKDSRFKDYKLIWAFHDPDKFDDVKQKIKSDSFTYFITTLKARVWITNSAIQRGMSYSGKNTFSLNTWHGSPLKKMGLDLNPDSKNSIMQEYSAFLAQSEYEKDKMSKAYNIDPNKFYVFGLPRNDALTRDLKEKQDNAKKLLGIPQKKKVILYAPTFRDYQVDDDFTQVLDIPLNYKKWEEKMGDEYVFLLRVHYEVAKHTQLPTDKMWMDVSNYQNLDTLMLASDLLITDYSSIMFDYAILKKPIICYTYDYKEYEEKRGMYFDVRDYLVSFENEDMLIEYLFSENLVDSIEKTDQFKKIFVEQYGSATKKSVDLIYESIQRNRNER